jgi:AcrR family transcriptional regulator
MSEKNTRKKILLAAGPIFARKGYRSATVREICDEAGVNVASVNYYFGDKQRLYSETVVLAREMRVQQAPNPTWDEGTPAVEKLHDFISAFLHRLVALESEPWQVRLLMREVLQPTETSRQMTKDYFRPFLETMLTIVDEIVGHKLPDFQRNQIGFSILGQCLYYRFLSEITKMMVPADQFAAHFSRSQLADHITKFSLQGMESFRTSSRPAANARRTLKLADELPVKHDG